MPYLNKVFLMGNLTRDPELRQVAGMAFCSFGLAVNRQFQPARGGETREETCFVEIETWGKSAEVSGQYLRKGRSVLVEGRLQMDTWEKDGQKHQKLKIRAMTVKFMPVPAPNQSRLTGEPVSRDGMPQASQGEMDGYDDEQPF